MARLGLVEEEGGLSLVQAEARRHVNAELLVSQEDVGSAKGLVPADEVVRPGELMAEVLVHPQDEILRRFVESSGCIAGASGIPGPQDLLDRRKDRVLPVAVAEGTRRGTPNRLLPDRKRFEVVDR